MSEKCSRCDGLGFLSVDTLDGFEVNIICSECTCGISRAELARLRAVDSLLNAFVEDVNQIPVSVEPFTSMGIADPSYFERVGRFTVARIDQLKGEVTS